MNKAGADEFRAPPTSLGGGHSRDTYRSYMRSDCSAYTLSEEGAAVGPAAGDLLYNIPSRSGGLEGRDQIFSRKVVLFHRPQSANNSVHASAPPLLWWSDLEEGGRKTALGAGGYDIVTIL